MEELVQAIRNRSQIRVSYKDTDRIIEPHALGSNSNSGKTLLRAYQVEGGSASGASEGWKLMDLQMLNSVEFTGESFQVRDSYKRNDSAMTGGIIEEI